MRIDGERLRRARLGRALSQQELATACEVDVMTISRLERGAVGGVRPSTLRKLAAALKVDPETLIDWSDENGADQGKVKAA